jgi:hypothetical protein
MNWLLKPTSKPSKNMADWEIEPLGVPRPNDDVVYSALGLVNDSFAVPAVVVKPLASPEWLGDMAYCINGRWQGPQFDKSAISRFREVYVANPLDEDPSFFGEDTRRAQRSGFELYKSLLGKIQA